MITNDFLRFFSRFSLSRCCEASLRDQLIQFYLVDRIIKINKTIVNKLHTSFSLLKTVPFTTLFHLLYNTSSSINTLCDVIVKY